MIIIEIFTFIVYGVLFMAHIKNLCDIPVPEEARPDGNRVYINKDIGGGKQKKVYIGTFTRKDIGDRGYFQPNENLLKYFPEIWKRNYGDKHLTQPLLSCGLYAFTLGLTHLSGLYDSIYYTFGPEHGNAIIDFAMYSVKERLNVAYLFKPAMEKNVLFSAKRLDDTDFSAIFTEGITDDQIDEFRKDWIEKCKKNGLKRVWLTVDGSNSNCEAQRSELTGKGEAKSKRNITIISYIWAINAETGEPVTFFLNKGGTSDSRMFEDISAFLKANGVEIEGIILDRGFLSESILRDIVDSGYNYLIMLKEDTHGFIKMYEEKAKDIRWNIKYVIGHGGRFGVTDGPRDIMKNGAIQAYIGLFFDGKNGTDRKATLTDKIYDAVVEANKQISEGKKPVIPPNVSKYLKVVDAVRLSDAKQDNKENENNETKIENTTEKSIPGGNTSETIQSATVTKEAQENIKKDIDKEETHSENLEASKKQDNQNDGSEPVFIPEYTLTVLDEIATEDLNKKGFSGMACSKNITAEEMDRLYDTRDASEKQYMISKSMLGQSVFRGHTTECQISRALVNFVASIIRKRFQNASKKQQVKNALELERLDNNLYLYQASSGDYLLVNKLSTAERAIFKENGVKEKDFEIIAGDINERIRANKGQGTVSQYHESPKQIQDRIKASKKKNKSSKKNGHSEKTEASHCEQQEEKNTNTSELEGAQEIGQKEASQKPKHKGGRPLGSKNKKTLEREAAEKAQGVYREPNHKRGRPLGSKNKKTLEKEARGELPKKPGIMGRPMGRKDSKPRHRRTQAEINASKDVKKNA